VVPRPDANQAHVSPIDSFKRALGRKHIKAKPYFSNLPSMHNVSSTFFADQQTYSPRKSFLT
jgi:hypothetical protein